MCWCDVHVWYMNTCVKVYTCRGSIILSLVPIRQGFSLKLELDLWATSPREPAVSALLNTRVIDVDEAMHNFLCKCLGLNHLFRYSCLCSKHFQLLIHLPSPDSSPLLKKWTSLFVEIKGAVYLHGFFFFTLDFTQFRAKFYNSTTAITVTAANTLAT